MFRIASDIELTQICLAMRRKSNQQGSIGINVQQLLNAIGSGLAKCRLHSKQKKLVQQYILDAASHFASSSVGAAKLIARGIDVHEQIYIALRSARPGESA